MTVQTAVDNRQTEHAIVVTFQNWTELLLYDSRRTPYDVPLALAEYPVESVNTSEYLTIIEI